MYRDTYIEREPGEKINDRNDRAIRVSVAWYESHLMPSQVDRRKKDRVRVIFLTDDAENKSKAENDGLQVTTGMLFCVVSFAQ
jgi:exosome complex exonuclease DIS3/RRP44